jgi:hypothetical protein
MTRYHPSPLGMRTMTARDGQEDPVGRVIVFILIAMLVAGLVARNLVRARRIKKDEKPEINKHPERLDQMLDPTDDA